MSAWHGYNEKCENVKKGNECIKLEMPSIWLCCGWRGSVRGVEVCYRHVSIVHRYYKTGAKGKCGTINVTGNGHRTETVVRWCDTIFSTLN